MALSRKKKSMSQAKRLYMEQYKELTPLCNVILITWNPKPGFYNYDKYGDNDFDIQWVTMLDVLLRANRCCSNYAFVAEVSEQGKLHMHGFLVVSDKIKYLRSFLPTLRKNGFIKVSKANSHDWKTFKYHIKDIKETGELINKFPIVLTKKNYLEINRDVTLLKVFVPINDEKVKIKKRNVMEMIRFESESE